MKRSAVRWIPAIVAPLVVAGSVIGVSVSASAGVALPVKTPSQILQFINKDPNIALSGTVTKIANLGLPAVNLLPNISQATVDQMKKTLPKQKCSIKHHVADAPVAPFDEIARLRRMKSATSSSMTASRLRENHSKTTSRPKITMKRYIFSMN